MRIFCSLDGDRRSRRPGFGKRVEALPEGSSRANTVRDFQDCDYVFAHTDYSVFGPKIGFDIFRFEDGKTADHWDTLETVPAREEWKNPNGKFGF